ncbi:MAG: hypothetical protein ACKVIF_01675, partial [Rhodospirillales bacterium]
MAAFNPSSLDPSFRKTSGNYQELFEDLGNEVYRGRILGDAFCDDVLERVKQFNEDHKNVETTSANSMHFNAVSTSQINLDPMVHSFVEFFLKEIAPTIL